MKRIVPGLRSLDMFGYEPRLTFKGQTAFTTYTGILVSIGIYSLMILNLIQVSTAFQNGSNQNQSYNPELIDRFSVEP